MTKFFILILWFTGISGTCNQQSKNNVELQLIIDTLSKGGIAEWYQIHKQFINISCNSFKKNASAYLCVRKATGDTVWVISPCVQNHYNKNTGAALYIDDNIKIGDTVFINIPKAYSTNLDKFTKVFGTLKIPYD